MLDNNTIIEIIKALGVAVVAIITGAIGTALKFAHTGAVTQKELSDTTDKIYDDMEQKIEKATKDLASKESVANLGTRFDKVEKKLDDVYDKIQELAINCARLAERRKEPRG